MADPDTAEELRTVAPPAPRRPFDPARAQVALAGLLLAIICGTCLSVDGLARSPAVAERLMRSELREWKAKGLQNQHKVFFIDFEDRLLLDELPKADYSRGGVYFLGASTVKVSIMPWVLGDELSWRVGNYGLSAATPDQQFQFLRYLVEHKGLAAGGDRNLVVLGLYYGTAVDAENRPNAEYFPQLFRRHGLYTYDTVDGIAPVPMSGVERTLRIEKARCAGFLDAAWHGGTRSSFKPTKHDPEAFRQYRIRYMGDHWREEMAHQVDEIGRMMDYLLAHNLRVRVLYMPVATWDDPLPYPAEFRKQTQALCQARNVPVTDLTKLLGDSDYYDSSHANYAGQQKLHQAMLEVVKDHLRQVDGK